MMSDELREQTKNIESLRLRAAADLYISQIDDLDTLDRLVDKRRRELTEGMTSCQQSAKSRF
jgi:hypothetical protein